MTRWLFCTALLWGAAAGCADPAAEDLRPTGDPCAFGLQCAGEFCIGESLGGEPTGWTDGMCTEHCLEAACGDDEVCVDLGDGRYCLPHCEAATDCRDGYVCHSMLNACFPDCALTGCVEGLECSADGECRVPRREEPPNRRQPPEDKSPLGAPCTEHADCASQLCLGSDSGRAVDPWVDGMCSAPCGLTPCPEGSGCLPGPAGNICLPTCQGTPRSSTCRSGYVCDPMNQLCLPDCNNGWLCPPGATCKASGICGGMGGPGGGH